MDVSNTTDAVARRLFFSKYHTSLLVTIPSRTLQRQLPSNSFRNSNHHSAVSKVKKSPKVILSPLKCTIKHKAIGRPKKIHRGRPKRLASTRDEQ
ncbi:hypothetical protein J6590_048557, partial [Homalodisca vitripennis]